jgi:hypothetical protein
LKEIGSTSRFDAFAKEPARGSTLVLARRRGRLSLHGRPHIESGLPERHWCQQRAGEYVAAVGLRVNDDDVQKIAKAIGRGAQKAVLTLQRQAQCDFSPEGLGSAPVLRVSPAKPVWLSALLEGWAAEKQPIPRTIYNWTRALEQFATFIGHNDAARMTPEDLVRWKAVLLEAGLRTKTVRDAKIAPLRAILQWGVDNRKIPMNPAARVTIDVRSNTAERHPGFHGCRGDVDLAASGERA